MQTTKTIAATQHPKRTKVKIKEISLIIKYKNRVFEIKPSELRNLGLGNFDEVREYCTERGLDPYPEFTQNCLWCAYNSNSIDKYFVGSGDTSKGVQCNYKSDNGKVEVASSFTNKRTGQKIRALEHECVFNEALVYVLSEKGLLDKFETKKDFSFRPISDFEQGKANPIDYEIKRKKLFKRFLNLFRTNN